MVALLCGALTAVVVGRAIRLTLVLALFGGCSAAEGTVLVLRDRREPSGSDSGVRDGGSAGRGGSGADVGPVDSGADTADASELDASTSTDGSTINPTDAAPSGDSGTASNTLGVCRITGARDGFYENFNGTSLDSNHWLVAHGPFTFAGSTARGGFARENVQVRDGSLRLLVRGDRYSGDVRSIDGSGAPLASGKRSAAAIATRDLFGSGTYQIQGFPAGPASVELAIWFVRDDDSQGAIDLTTPGKNATARNYGYVRMRTRDSSTANDVQFSLGKNLDDGASHILRFDWYTTTSKSVSFWVDDELRAKSMRSLPPPAAGRLWIMAWVPDDSPADFDTAEIRLDNAFVTPFGNDGDVCTNGELEGPSLARP
jgi:hypothetical protein